MTQNHTPGPWMVEKRTRPNEQCVHYSIRTVDRQPDHPWSPRFIAWMTGCLLPYAGPNVRPDDAPDDPITEADARLIAAAPAMYAALLTIATAPRDRYLGQEIEDGMSACEIAALAVATADAMDHPVEEVSR